jgi:hypothetical protein
MKKTLFRLFIFVIILFAIIFQYKKNAFNILTQRFGMSLENIIDRSFKLSAHQKYECFVMGNSRMYRGVDPSFLDVSSFNFSNDNDSFDKVWLKMMYLKRKNINYQTLVLGVDYFLFSYIDDSRDYAYEKWFNDDSNEYLKSIKFYLDEYSNYQGWEKTKIIIETIDTLIKNPNLSSFAGLEYKENGHLLDTWHAALETDAVDRQYSILEVQKKAFLNIINYCKKSKIKLFLVMPPVRKNEMRCYPDSIIEKFDNYFSSFNSKNVKYLNYSMDDDFLLEDYSDITHLNGFGAKKLTLKLNLEIIKKR